MNDTYAWSTVVEFTILAALLGAGTLLKRKIKFFRKFLIPNSIIAGFVGLLLGSEILGLIHLDANRLGTLVYHLMAVGFIALALKDRKREKGVEITNTGLFIVSTYMIQGIVALGITLIMAATVFPDLLPSFGLILPLGFGQGPGQAYSIGSQWETLGALPYGGNIGLTIAAIGFLWACIGGIPLINILLKKRKFKVHQKDDSIKVDMIEESDRPDDIPLSDSIDRISVQIFLIGIVYLITYLTIYGASLLLANLGSFGENLATLLWGFHFIIGAVYAILLRIILDAFKKKGVMTRNYPNNFLLQRIAGGSFDFMITAGICAISISALKYYLVPTLVITTVGMLLTAGFTIVMSKWLYKSHQLESTVAMYGMLTGTISTGLALLREVDPNFDSPVAKHLVLGSGVGLLFGFPLLVLLNIPVMAYTTNTPSLYLLTFVLLIAYFLFLLLLMHLNKKRAARKEKLDIEEQN